MPSALESMHARRSIRAFEPTIVPAEAIRRIVDAAGRAPSSKNTQPWRLFLVQGVALAALRADYLAAFDAGEKPRPAYRYSPDPLPPAWQARAKEVGIGILKHKGITREDTAGRRAHDRENFEFFDAPHVFFLGTDGAAFGHGTFLDCGFMLDNLMLGLASLGYGSCPQYSAVSYPDILARHLPADAGTLFVAGLAFGTPKQDAPVNAFQTTRLPLEAWFQVVG
jgi:nitroreductase